MPLPRCPKCRHAMNFEVVASQFICHRCDAAERDRRKIAEEDEILHAWSAAARA